MPDFTDDIDTLISELGMIEFDPAVSQAEREIATATLNEILPGAIANALKNFRKGTPVIMGLTTRLFNRIDRLNAPPSASLRSVAVRLARMQAELHDEEGMRTTWQSSDEFLQTFDDEAESPSSGAVMALPAAPAGATLIVDPKPMNSRKFVDLADEYIRFFASQDYKNASSKTLVKKQAEIALENKARYVAVGDPLGIPWWFVAGIHLLESSFNFTRHLHNGDGLDARTHRVPAGRPVAGNPPFTWEESARDALTGEGLADKADWSLARALYRWEAYNGFGYRPRGVPTPYLWSMSNIYSKGKYVGDGTFDETAVSKQVGAAVLLKMLIELDGEEVAVEATVEGDGDGADTNAADAAAVVANALPNADGVISTNINFKDFFEAKLPGLEHFEWHEFLVKGASHANNQLNTDPPRALWDNVVPLARILNRIRAEIGHPMVLTSVYRSPEYNAAVGGATQSQHMQFTAADFQVPGHGTPADWHGVVSALRDAGAFSGGIGLYNSFVHVDVRGFNVNF